MSCPDLSSVSGGSVEMITDGRTTVWALSCDAGTSVSGTGTLSCQEDGTWSSVQPSCSKFLCESLSVRPDRTGYIPVKKFV